MKRWEDFEVGTAAEPRTMGPITRTDIVRYQGASGDFQPIHHDEPLARRAGYDAPLGIGMLQASALGAYVAEWISPEQVRGMKFRFRAPVFPGDRVQLSAVVTRRDETGNERRIDVEMNCSKADGTVVVTGEATFVWPG